MLANGVCRVVYSQVQHTFKFDIMRNRSRAGRSLDLHELLHAYALRLTCGNRYLAHDLLLETLERIAQRATACHPAMVDFDTWAKMVMMNAFHETVPDAQKRELYNLFYHGTLNPMAPLENENHSLRRQIHIMSRLTSHQAAAMTLLLNGYSLDVIAGEMDITVEGVKSHLAKARIAMIGMCGS